MRRELATGFNSVAALIDAIETWVEHWNDDPKPFVWHKSAEEIVANVRRGRAALAEVKSATQDSLRLRGDCSSFHRVGCVAMGR